VRDVSAGGVVFRQTPEGVEVALVGRITPQRWALAKGAPHRDEPMEQAALREVEEETGLQARVITPLGEVEYWFVLRGVRHHTTVYFYLMEATGGDVSLHDHEYDLVEWFPIRRALEVMSYPNEARLVEKAAALLEARALPLQSGEPPTEG
jgi:8-oxo-dGTP pyrophosphatase MutT (NUDIX family)